ncbi:hypothetical protein ACIQC5_13870 [Paenarthrobacter sp. NPDC092416]|uniref:hypothetical protein n=1 Tax=Paenarthrobacter sp. NPDC092416 TaxID=3364386 RepID=UPI003821E2DD
MSASFRLLRTGLIASLIIGLASGGHLAGGGVLPEPAILLGLCALTVLPVSILTKFRLSFPVLTGLLGAGQAWLHWAFHSFSAAAPAGGTSPAGHAHHSSGLELEAIASGVPAQAAADDWQMVAAHALATVMTAVVLARGEQALWSVAAWLRPLMTLSVPCTIVPARVPGPCTAPMVLPRDLLDRRIPVLRGPPAMMPAV